MSELSDISVMLGEVRGDMRSALKWFDNHEARDQDRFEKLADRIDMLGRSLTKLQDAEKVIKKIEPVVDSLQKMKWTTTGFLAGVGVLGGVVGSILTQVSKLIH